MNTTKQYYVEWRINVTADSAYEAAENARRHQTDCDTTAVVFHVKEMDNADDFVVIDLMEDESEDAADVA